MPSRRAHVAHDQRPRRHAPPRLQKRVVHPYKICVGKCRGAARQRPRSGPPEAAPTGRLALSPGSTLRHQISTLSRHYPDTIPTLSRHPDTPTPVSIDTRSDTPTPVSGQCQAILTLDLIGQRQAVSMVSKQNRHSDTRHPRHPRHPDTRHHIVALLAAWSYSTMAQTGVSGPVVVDGESFLDALFASAGQV